MIYTLVQPDDPILTTPATPFDWDAPGAHETAQQIAENMLATMEQYNGIGLAANQVGLPDRVFVCAGEPFAVFNPKIVDTSNADELLEEGCLTYPGLVVKVKRKRLIRVRFQNVKGETVTEKFGGMTARIFQHEMEHLDGKIFYQAANRFHREQAMRKYNKYLRHPERFKLNLGNNNNGN